MRTFFRAKVALLVTGCMVLLLAPTAASAARSRPTVKIMVIADSSGVAPYLPSMEVAAQDAAKTIKSVKFTVLICDGKDDPNQEAACAQSAVSDHVAAVFALTFTQGQTVLPVMQDAGIPVFWGATITGVEDQSPISMLPTSPNPSLFGGMGVVPKLIKANHVTIITSDISKSVTEITTTTLAASKTKVAGQVNVPFSPPGSGSTVDVTPYAAAVAAQHPGAVVMIAASANYIQPLRQAGVTAPLIIADVGDPTLTPTMQSLPKSMTNNVYRVSSTSPFDTRVVSSATKTFIDAVGNGSSKSKNVTPYAWNVWVGMHAIASVASSQSVVTSTSLRRALDRAKSILLVDGVKWTPSAVGPTGYQRDSDPHAYLSRWSGKGWVIASPPGVNGINLPLSLFG